MRLREMSEGTSPPPGYGTFMHGEEDNVTMVTISAESNSLTSGVDLDEMKVLVNRDVLTQASLEKLSEESHCSQRFSFSSQTTTRKQGCCRRWLNFVCSVFPVVGWMSEYSFKESLLTDVVAGFTLGVMQVPQGMAYAMLAGVAPVFGLYTSFYPVLVYFFLGTSRQASIGTFALVSMLTNSAMDEVLKSSRSLNPNSRFSLNVTAENDASASIPNELSGDDPGLDPIQAAMVVAFLVGLIELLMGFARMGSLTVLMSDHMISGMITGTAIQVLTSQIPALTGAPLPKRSGVFNMIYTWVDFFKLIESVHMGTLAVSACSLISLGVVKGLVDPPCRRVLRVPFPSELLLIVAGTGLSWQFSFQTKQNIAVIGPIPTGLVAPSLPHLTLVPSLLTGSCVVSIVAVSLSLSIVMAYAKKHEYRYDANKELLAYGVSNLVGSFFSCIPCSVSLSRSAVLDSSGAKSQLSTLVSCSLLLVVILILGPLFQDLPDAVLSAIIVVALRSMLLGVTDFFQAWKTSKTEAIVWLVTFLGVLILDIDYGLGVGVFFSLALVVYKAQHPSVKRLGHVAGTELYRDPEKYPSAREVPGVSVVHFNGVLYFGNRDALRSKVLAVLTHNQRRKDKHHLDRDSGHVLERSWCSMKKDYEEESLKQYRPSVHHIVLSCTAIPFVDSEGAAAIVQLAEDCKNRQVQLYFAGFQDTVLESLTTNGFWNVVPREFVFPTVHDATLAAVDASVNSDNIMNF